MRVVSHAQHLTGVGHAVISHVIASEFATAHDVYLVDGGRHVPRPTPARGLHRLTVPMLQRDERGTLVGANGEPGDVVLVRRTALLSAEVRALRPDVVMVDHYPFSKWELGTEITEMIHSARAVNPRVRVVCSLRDIAPRTRYEALDDEEYTTRVVDLLEDQFDALIIHSDPTFIALDDFCSLTRPLPVATEYSGFVSEPVPSWRPPMAEPFAVLSTGGIDAPAFLAATITAYRRVADTDALGAMPLHVFAGLGAEPRELAALAAAAAGGPVTVHPFSSDFTAWLHASALSISRCGYNTSTALMRSCVPAVVVPAINVSDQRLRAECLERAGIACIVPGSRETDIDALADAIRRAVAAPRPSHKYDLDGAAATRRIVEAISGD